MQPTVSCSSVHFIGLGAAHDLRTFSTASSGTSLPFIMSCARIAAYAASTVKRFARRFSGFLLVPVTSTYMIYLISNDGSIIFVDGDLMINNNGECCPAHAVTIRLCTSYLLTAHQTWAQLGHASQLGAAVVSTSVVGLRDLAISGPRVAHGPVSLMASTMASR